MKRFYKRPPRVLYFAYGSNLDGAQMHERCPSAVRVGAARLDGVAIRFAGYSVSRKGPVATLERSPGSSVPGVVYEVSADDMARLDRFEGAPQFYQRCACKVELAPAKRSGKPRIVEAQTYVLTAAVVRNAPHRGYLKIIADAYEAEGFDVTALKRAARAS